MDNTYFEEKMDRERRREADRQKHKQGNTKDKVKKLFALFVVVLVVAGLVGSIIPFNPAPSSTTQQIGEIPAVTSADWISGNVDSNIVFVEYADFQCPACAAYHPLLKKLKQEYGTKVKFVFRHFPLTQVHPNALLASYAAEAAGAQGKFWEMHDKLFETQSAWSTSANAQSLFESYAGQLGLNVDQFKKDIDSGSTSQKVTSQQSGGTLAGIDSTPTFFINGKKIQNPNSYEALKNTLEVALPK